ncbi:MAG: hypothetical protein PSY14_00190 [bacterium]|nr:hypothetical protein [bacterium]
MNISAQFFDDILNDATLATTAQGQCIAQAHNDNNAAHSAYDVFRRRWQQQYDAYAVRVEVLLNQSDLEKSLNHFQRNMPQDADGIAAGLDALTAKVNDNEQVIKDHSAETDLLRKAFGALAVAEGKIENLVNWTAADTRATLQKLQDTSQTGSIDRVRRGRNSSYARIKDDATRRMQGLNDDAQAQEESARRAFNSYLNGGFVTAEPVTAPATASFRRKPQVQP